ncbi:hypothetical protein O3P69_006225 [Scylla paramamosain]|uniref:Uncharacterized protein n=1 Tax=Scylla paramamosain TaxID=85552 RepID=A0AAW0U5U1_SCYPA
MYSNPANRLYLAFLQPVVSQVNRVNKMFESDNCNVNKLLVDLMSLYQSILLRLMMPRTFSTWKARPGVVEGESTEWRLPSLCQQVNNHLPLQAVDFELARSRVDSRVVDTIKKYGRDFLMQLLTELRARLPCNIHHLQSLDVLTPDTVLGVRKSRLQELTFLPRYSGDVGQLDEQWQTTCDCQLAQRGVR